MRLKTPSFHPAHVQELWDRSTMNVSKNGFKAKFTLKNRYMFTLTIGSILNVNYAKSVSRMPTFIKAKNTKFSIIIVQPMVIASYLSHLQTPLTKQYMCLSSLQKKETKTSFSMLAEEMMLIWGSLIFLSRGYMLQSGTQKENGMSGTMMLSLGLWLILKTRLVFHAMRPIICRFRLASISLECSLLQINTQKDKSLLVDYSMKILKNNILLNCKCF